jgi:hypothetical protein
MSSSQHTCHIHIRYFFVKDRVDEKEIIIIHCPTGIMIEDFFTKLLKGALFELFRDIILGKILPMYPDQECVEN